MEIIDIIKNYWILITFAFSVLSAFLMFILAMIQAVKCSLRNDILDIYDRCKELGQVSYWQLDSIEHSYKIYKVLRGNSFVEDLVKKVRTFELVD